MLVTHIVKYKYDKLECLKPRIFNTCYALLFKARSPRLEWNTVRYTTRAGSMFTHKWVNMTSPKNFQGTNTVAYFAAASVKKKKKRFIITEPGLMLSTGDADK